MAEFASNLGGPGSILNKIKLYVRAGKVDQWVRTLAPKSDGLSSVPGTHVSEGGNQLWQVL